MATEWDDWIDEDEDLRISDLGDSFLQGEEPEELAQPGALLAPETILASSFDCRLDLWRAGITVRTFPFLSPGEQNNDIRRGRFLHSCGDFFPSTTLGM